MDRFKKIFCSFLLFCCLSIPIHAKENVVVASNLALSPYCLLGANGGEGFELDLINKIAEINDWDIQILKIPFRYFFDAIEEGKADLLLSGLFKNPEREEKFTISQPYSTAHDVIMFINPDIKINDNKDLLNLKVAVTSHSVQERNLIALGIPKENIISADSLFLAFKEMMTGKADAVLGYDNVLKYMGEKRNKELKFYRFQGVPTREIVALAKKGNTSLIDKFNSALETLKANGEYEKLEKKWTVN